MHILKVGRGAARVFVVAFLALATGCGKATLTAPPTSSISVTATPDTISENGGTSVIRAVVRLPNGQLIPDGVIVNFFTTLGQIDASATSAAGAATATLRATGSTGIARVTATSGSAPAAKVDVTIGSLLDTVIVSFSPTSLPTGGGTATVIAELRTAAGAPLSGRGVTLSTSAGTLASAGATKATDAQGRVSDTLTTTVSSTVTASVVGSILTGSATITIGASDVAGLNAYANPASLPASGGSTEINAFVTGPGGAPVAGQVVLFATSVGSLSASSVVTDSSGRSRVTLTTSEAAEVTVEADSLSATVMVALGGSVPATYSLTTTATRNAVTEPGVSRTTACDTTQGNPQLPIDVTVRVADTSDRPVAGISVTLTIDDDPSDAYDGRGGFCPAAGSATGECCPLLTQCPTPLPTPTPSPTPVPPATPTPTPVPAVACCAANTLSSTATATSDSNGLAHFLFTFEDTDLCDCAFNVKRCTGRLLATASKGSAVNQLVISFNP